MVLALAVDPQTVVPADPHCPSQDYGYGYNGPFF